MNSLYEEPIAALLDEMRAKARAKRRITFDCYHATEREGHVYCKVGFKLHPRGYIALLTVLRGGSSIVCKKCKFYSPGNDNEN